MPVKKTTTRTRPAAKDPDAQTERSFETMSDEFFKAASANMYNNMKLTYDQTLNHCVGLNNIALQALQNAVTVANKCAMNSAETDNMIAKQAVAHRDIAVDSTWDPGPGEESLKPKS
jgi:hypothetical protein